MRYLLIAVLPMLFGLGCGKEEPPKSKENNAPKSDLDNTSITLLDIDTANITLRDLDDKAIRDKIVAEASDYGAGLLEWREKEGEQLAYLPDTQKPFSGWLKNLHGNGEVAGLTQFLNGKVEGVSMSWYENGQKSKQSNWKNGKQEGLRTEWHGNGLKSSEDTFNNGKKNGSIARWYASGKKKTEEQFKNGLREGLHVLWDEFGNKVSETTYKDGVVMDLKEFK